ncbi:MAG: glycosyltransferase [Chthoniobacteraceae bacterium]
MNLASRYLVPSVPPHPLRFTASAFGNGLPFSCVPNPRLLFISNQFPDQSEPGRGLDNATLLHQLSDRWDIRALLLRPQLPFQGRPCLPREIDRAFRPHYVATYNVPKFGSRINHRFTERALRRPLMVLRGQYDLILSAWIYPDCCAVAPLARAAGVPWMAVATGADVHSHLRNVAQREILLGTLSGAAAIITRSREIATEMRQAGMLKDRIHTIHNGVDQTIFQPGDRAAARQELGLPADARIIVFVGDFVADKHPTLLIEAFSRVIADDGFDNVLLVCVGSGPLEDDLRWRVDRDCPDRVVFAGRRETEGVARCMQAADVLCLPSSYEGVPNVVLEAFATGLPVVASRVGGIPEVHPEGKLGRLVPPGDTEALVGALTEVLNEMPDREAIHRHAAGFTWAKSADAYDAVLRQALGANVR